MSAASSVLRSTAARPSLRLTRPRRTVVSLIEARGSGHFTAFDLIDDAERRGVRVGRATIFRTLDLLQASGAVERLDLPDGGHAYVACRSSHHHHVVCISCGRAVDVADGDLGQVVRAVQRSTGYAIEGHRLELYGRCPACQAEAARP